MLKCQKCGNVILETGINFKEFSWWIPLKKLMLGLIYIFICAGLYYVTNKPEVAFLVPVMMSLQNILKHKLGWDWL